MRDQIYEIGWGFWLSFFFVVILLLICITFKFNLCNHNVEDISFCLDILEEWKNVTLNLANKIVRLNLVDIKDGKMTVSLLFYAQNLTLWYMSELVELLFIPGRASQFLVALFPQAEEMSRVNAR